VLEPLGRAVSGPRWAEVVALLGAGPGPGWRKLRLVRAADLETMRRRMARATRDRMLRELRRRGAADRPAAARAVLEDLHWSDASPRRAGDAGASGGTGRLLVLGTYRLPDALQRTIRCRRAPRVAAAWAVHGPAAPVAPRSGRGRLPDDALPGRPPPGRTGALWCISDRGHPAVQVTVVEGGSPRLARPGDGGWTLRVALAPAASTVPGERAADAGAQLERRAR